MYKQIALSITLAIIFCFFISPVYCQIHEEEYKLTQQQFLKAQKEDAQNAEKKKIENIKLSHCFYELYAALSIKKNDMTLCEKAGNRETVKNCIEHANFLFIITNLASGNCDVLQEPFKGLCNGLTNSCASMKNNANMCEAIKKNNTDGITKASNAPTWAFAPGAGLINNENARHTLAIYYGSKKNSAAECEKYVSDNSVRRAACKVLFLSDMSISGFNDMIGNLIDQYKSSDSKKTN